MSDDIREPTERLAVELLAEVFKASRGEWEKWLSKRGAEWDKKAEEFLRDNGVDL